MVKRNGSGPLLLIIAQLNRVLCGFQSAFESRQRRLRVRGAGRMAAVQTEKLETQTLEEARKITPPAETVGL